MKFEKDVKDKFLHQRMTADYMEALRRIAEMDCRTGPQQIRYLIKRDVRENRNPEDFEDLNL
jgi:hypothetical protein